MLACFFSSVAALGMFIPPYPIKGSDFILLASVILGIYSGANIVEKIGWPSNKKMEG